MRTKNSIINSLVGLASYVILLIGPLALSPVVASLGSEILGIQKTFMDTVALLNIVELGISFGVIYKLYKPIAENYTEKIAILLNFYKNTFKIKALILTSLGLLTAVIMPQLVPEHDASKFSDNWLVWMFLLYLADTLATYLFGHKRAMLIADQRNYLVSICRTSCQVLMYIFQLISVCHFRSFELYVASKLFCTLLDSVFIHVIYNLKYKNIDLKIKKRLEKSERSDLFKNLGALFYHKIGYQSLASGSTLIITSHLGESITGMYYPYTLITNGLMSITDQVFNAILTSFGNLLVKATEGEVHKVYKKIFFLNHMIYSFFSVSLFCLIGPFIKLWMGKAFLFPMATIILITVNFYMFGMRKSITMVKNSAGLYRPDRYFALIETALNLGFALLFVDKLGLNGVIIANILSSFLVPFWTQPYVVYKNVFNRSVSSYYKKSAVYAVITLISGILTYYICSLFNFEGFLKLIINAFICLMVPNCINIFIFYKTDEFQYLFGIIKNIFEQFRMRK